MPVCVVVQSGGYPSAFDQTVQNFPYQIFESYTETIY